MRKYCLGLLVVLLNLLPGLSFGQPGGYSTSDKGAIKRYESGVACMQQRKMECAFNEFSKAAQADERFVEPRIMLAEIAEQRGQDDEAITRYREVMAIAPRFFPTAQLHLADLEFRHGQYAEAEKNYKGYLEKEQDPQRKARARLGLDNCTFAARAIQQPVPFEPKNLGPAVNSADPEYYPCITADDATLIYTRRVKDPELIPWGMQEDFMVSHRDAEGTWQAAKPIPTVNTRQYNEGAGTLTPDGRFIVFTKCATEDGSYGVSLQGFGSCDLFISRRIGDRWTPPENLGPPVNSRNWQTQRDPDAMTRGSCAYSIDDRAFAGRHDAGRGALAVTIDQAGHHVHQRSRMVFRFLDRRIPFNAERHHVVAKPGKRLFVKKTSKIIGAKGQQLTPANANEQVLILLFGLFGINSFCNCGQLAKRTAQSGIIPFKGSQ